MDLNQKFDKIYKTGLFLLVERIENTVGANNRYAKAQCNEYSKIVISFFANTKKSKFQTYHLILKNSYKTSKYGVYIA